MTYKFKVGQRVRIKEGTNYFGKFEGTIAEFIHYIGTTGEVCEVRVWSGEPYMCHENMLEDEQEYLWHKNKKCECGSKFTEFPDIHMFFCPMHPDSKPKG